MLDLRSLLTKYNIYWRDKGKNCSPGNVNIACVLCGDDPSEHLAIAENLTDGYYCFRNPQHGGKNLHRIFRKLNIPEFEYKELKPKQDNYTPPVEKDYSDFLTFQRASANNEALIYLRDRGFEQAIKVADRFNLKIAPMGKWARRLIIPLTIGWTGRAMLSSLEPRYLSQTSDAGFFSVKNQKSSCIILEGPLDAMRIASVSNQFDIVAKCGSDLKIAILNYLKERSYSKLLYLPDNGVPFLQTAKDTKALSTYCTQSQVETIHFPTGKKDACECSEKETREWLQGFLYSRSGQEFTGIGLGSTSDKIAGE